MNLEDIRVALGINKLEVAWEKDVRALEAGGNIAFCNSELKSLTRIILRVDRKYKVQRLVGWLRHRHTHTRPESPNTDSTLPPSTPLATSLSG